MILIFIENVEASRIIGIDIDGFRIIGTDHIGF